MRSKEIAPPDKRSSLPKDVLIQALEAAEKSLEKYESKYIAKHFVSMRDKLDELREEISETTNVLSAEDKIYERIMRYYDLLGDFISTLEAMEKKISPEDVKAAETQANTKNIVSLVQNKDDYMKNGSRKGAQ